MLYRTNLPSLRAEAAIQHFRLGDFSAALDSFDGFSASMDAMKMETVDALMIEPFLQMVQMVAIKKLKRTVDENFTITLRNRLAFLRKESPNDLQTQKDKFDALIEDLHNKKANDDLIEALYEVGVEVGITACTELVIF